MKSDKICPESGTRNHIEFRSVGSDGILSSDRQSDPTTEKHAVSVLCLILIELKNVVFGS
jgi:hypothetical protein